MVWKGSERLGKDKGTWIEVRRKRREGVSEDRWWCVNGANRAY